MRARSAYEAHIKREIYADCISGEYETNKYTAVYALYAQIIDFVHSDAMNVIDVNIITIYFKQYIQYIFYIFAYMCVYTALYIIRYISSTH
jgi:hypothetical protein